MGVTDDRRETTRAAVLGTGIMGSAMARNLLAAGLPTTVWDRSAAATRALAETGVVRPNEDPYRKGVKFLLGTQAADGSWHVGWDNLGGNITSSPSVALRKAGGSVASRQLRPRSSERYTVGPRCPVLAAISSRRGSRGSCTT